MRSVSIFLALAMVMAGTLAFLPRNVGAVDPPKLSITVEAWKLAGSNTGRTGGGGGGAAARDQTATLMDSAAAMGMSAERRMSSSWCTPAKDA